MVIEYIQTTKTFIHRDSIHAVIHDISSATLKTFDFYCKQNELQSWSGFLWHFVVKRLTGRKFELLAAVAVVDKSSKTEPIALMLEFAVQLHQLTYYRVTSRHVA